MPKIYEIFGYPLNIRSKEAEATRKKALCPFMNTSCDGGGNRYLSGINLPKKRELQKYFHNLTSVQSGVCSIQLQDDQPPWIVCPRRLLALGRDSDGENVYQKKVERYVLSHLGYKRGTRLGIWPEVKLKYKEGNKIFDYTFDYIVAPLKKTSETEIENITKKPWRSMKGILVKAGYTIARRGSKEYVENFPSRTPSIIEIMTSSTSGGDKKKRSTIPNAFEDAILGKPHIAPGINFRQVWARMVSQLIVKSEVANSWGGKAIWVVQDLLVNYISSTTALDLSAFISRRTSEVNLLSFSYGPTYKNPKSIVRLKHVSLHAGNISAIESSRPRRLAFQDIVRAPICPPSDALRTILARRFPTAIAVNQ